VCLLADITEGVEPQFPYVKLIESDDPDPAQRAKTVQREIAKRLARVCRYLMRAERADTLLLPSPAAVEARGRRPGLRALG
jgi:hypothetical protein